jgi:K+-dependent Na+/Ca+ exchanger-like protein
MLPARMGLTVLLLVGVAALTEFGILGSRGDTAARADATAVVVPGAHGNEGLSPVSSRQLAEATDLLAGVPCVEVAVANSSFPDLGFQIPEQQGAAVVVQLVVTAYMFMGLAIVCDSFFEASLSAICDAMALKDDVAGATWMAAGGSAPELATSVLGVFVSRSDVGFGTIVGSAVFNVLFVIACCAFAQPNLKLTWWPLARDAAYYCFSLGMIVIFISDDLQIAVWEAIVLLLMYTVYVTIMAYNETLEQFVTKRVKANENTDLQSAPRKMLIKMFDNSVFGVILYGIIATNAVMVILEIVDEGRRNEEQLWCVCGDFLGRLDAYSGYFYANLTFNIIFIVEMLTKFYAFGFFGYWKIPLNCFDGSLVFLIIVEFILTFGANSDGIGIGVARLLRLLKFIRFARFLRLLRVARIFVKPAATAVAPEGGAGTAKSTTPKDAGDKAKEVEAAEEEEDDDDDDGPFDPFEIPDGPIGKFFWFIGLPLAVAMWLTIPDCRRPTFGTKAWPLTFSMCIVWIGSLSFVMVWMVTAFGKIYQVRDSIMGVTLLAAGTSIPDCLSSIAVARRGHGDMAVSSSIGSNIFDVLIGLPLPWFLYTGILRPAAGPEMGPQWVPVQSESLAVMILSLFVMVALVITTIHISGWVLSVKLGAMMMVLYFMFLTLSLLLEFKVLLGDCTDGPPSDPAYLNSYLVGR